MNPSDIDNNTKVIASVRMKKLNNQGVVYKKSLLRSIVVVSLYICDRTSDLPTLRQNNTEIHLISPLSPSLCLAWLKNLGQTNETK